MANPRLPVLFTAFGVAAVLFLYGFYVNRVLAWLLSLFIRWQLWDPSNSSGSVHIRFDAVQLSLLSGRLLIKDLRYHSASQSFRIVKLKITWKYWLWSTRQGVDVAIGSADDEEGPQTSQSRRNEKDATLPCRVAVYIDGFEWFMYNRTGSYDDLLSRLKRQDSGNPTHVVEQHVDNPLHGFTSRGSATQAAVPRFASPIFFISHIIASVARWFTSLLSIDWKTALPLGLRIERGAIIIGNPSTPTVVVAQFAAAVGTVDTAASRCHLDDYKLVLNLRLKRVNVQMNENPDYDRPMLDSGLEIGAREKGRNLASLDFDSFNELLKNYQRGRRAEFNPGTTPDEYAQWKDILQTPLLDVTYYADTAGKVEPNEKTASDGNGLNVGNGDLPPEWGVEMVVQDSTLGYGPWADRQRAELQRVFFPPTYINSHATPLLQPGDTRVCLEMAVLIEFRGTTSLRVPFRRPSEDWKHEEEGRSRSASTLSLKIGDGSILRYHVPMVANEEGFIATLDLNMKSVTIAGLDSFEAVFLTAETCRVQATMPTPLQWNAHRQWSFNVGLAKPEIFLLRDHITLIQDLIKDWASGPPTDPYRFIPTTYALKISLAQFRLILNTNDHNIIDQLRDCEKNALLYLSGPSLTTEVVIPGDTFRPERVSVPFSVQVPDLSVSLTLPKWNTHAIFATKCTTDIGHIAILNIDGSFAYYAETRFEPKAPELVDLLTLDIRAQRVGFKCFGWAIRHFLNLKDNLFGMFTNQKLTAEYRYDRATNGRVGDPVEEKWRPGRSNAFEVVVDVQLEDGVIVLPCGLAGSEMMVAGANEGVDVGLGHSLVLDVPELAVTLRLHDYSMEMAVNIQPVIGAIVSDVLDEQLYSFQQRLFSKETLWIDGLHIIANRLFGPQPQTATYLCLWEISVGAVRSTMSYSDTLYAGKAFGSVGNNFSDVVNAPAKEYAVASDPDVTYLKFRLASLDVMSRAARTCFHIVLPKGLDLAYNDHAGQSYKSLVSLRLPVCIVRALVSLHADAHHWLEAASLRFDTFLDMYSAPAGWTAYAATQRAFCMKEDALTLRAPFLYGHAAAPGKGQPGAYLGGLYLPRAIRPEAQDPVQDVSLAASHLSLGHLSRDSPYNRRRPAVAALREHSGDDDDDESDADRDAFLARSRPITPRSTKVVRAEIDDDSALSSNDESDDHDSVGEISSDSEWSGLEDETIQGDTWPFAASYIKIVPRFRTGTGIHSDSALVVLDSHPSLWRHASEPPHRTTRLPETEPRVYVHQPPEEDRIGQTTVRLRTTQQVDICVSPLLVLVVDNLVDAEESSPRSFELLIDEYISAAESAATKDQSNPSNGRTILDVAMPSIRVRALQRIMSADEAAAMEPERNTSQLPTQSQVVSILDLQLTSVEFLAATAVEADQSPLPIQRLELKYSTLSLHIRAAQTHAQSGMNRSSRSLSTEVEIISGPVRACIVGGAVNVKTGDFSLDFQQRSSEAVIGSAASALRTIRRMSSRLATRRDARQRQFRRMVIACVNASSLKPGVTDLLGQVQPSFLLASGAPADIRMDAQWRVLIHIRHLFRHFNVHERTTLQRQLNAYADVSDTDFVTVQGILRQRLGDFVFDAETARNQANPLRQLLYPSPSPKRTTSLSTDPRLRRPIDFTFASDSASFALLTADERTDEFSSGSLEMQVHSRQMVFYPDGPGNMSSQASLNRSAKDLAPTHLPFALQVAVMVKLDACSTGVSPNLIPFTRHLLRVFRGFSAQFASPAASGPRSPVASAPAISPVEPHFDIVVDVDVQLPSVVFSTRAQHIAVDLRLQQAQLALTAKVANVGAKSKSHSISAILKLDEFAVDARDLRPKTQSSSQAKDVLASLSFRNNAISCVGQLQHEQPPKFRTVLDLHAIRFVVPRSALRLYQLIEEWRLNYLPELELMFQGLVSELERESKPKPKARARFASHTSPAIDVVLRIQDIRVTLHVMHGTWISWDVRDVVAYGRTTTLNGAEAQSYGLEVGAQGISIGPSAGEAETGAVRMTLPACRAAGTLAGRKLDCVAVLDTFRVKLKPHHFDDILAIQQKFGADFNDMLDLVAETRGSRPVRLGKQRSNSDASFKYSVQFNVQPFRIGVAGPSATQWFNVANVSGTVSNVDVRVLQLSITHVGLELTPQAIEQYTTRDSSTAIAYVSVDVHVQVTRVRSRPEEIAVQIPRLHAVMQPSSIGELGDLADYVQTEMLTRSQQRSADIAEMRSKTKKVLRTWDIKTKDVQPRDPVALLNNRIITLTISRLGIAFPLTHDHGIALQDIPHATASFATSSSQAFLLSIASMRFTTRRDEAGTATIQDLALQFVPRFNQAMPSDFEHKNHDTKNHLLYPRFSVDVRSQTSASMRSLHVSGDVEGFALSLDPSIANYVFSMIDVYREGKERLQRMAPLTEEVTASLPRSDSEPTPKAPTLAGLPTSHMRIKLSFASGRVHLHSANSHRIGGRSVFHLPKLTVWTEYKATAASHKFGSGSGDTESSMLLFSGLIHSSNNTVTPALLPFLTDLSHTIEVRMKQRASPKPSTLDMSVTSASPKSAALTLSTTSDAPAAQSSSASIGSMQLHLSLRLDESSLQFTCAPDVEITSGLYWKSGGFSLTVAPGARQMGFTGYISGVTAKLQHAYVPDTFFEANTENLAFAVSFSKGKSVTGSDVNLVSIVIDAELSAAVNMNRLQDGFCFKAIWLDRLPIFEGHSSTQSQPRREPSSLVNDKLAAPAAQKPAQDVPFVTFVLLRSRQLRLKAQIPRMAAIELELTSFVARANVSDVLTEIAMSFSKLLVTSTGTLSGTASIPDFTFQSLRRRNRSRPNPSATDLKMLQLFITSGRADVSLFSGGLSGAKLFHYEADPVRVHAFDDWAKATLDDTDEQQLSLNFVVDGSTITVSAGLLLVSKALEMQQRVHELIKDQREGALRDSRTFRSTWAPAPANPLSNVAEAMINSAKTRFKEQKELSYVISQNMRLRLESLRLHIFPNTLHDNQVIFVQGMDLFAHLRRVVKDEDLPLERKLLLSFSSLFLSKFHGIPTELAAMPHQSSGSGAWMQSVLKRGRQETILSVPGLRAWMFSEETDGPDDGALRVVKYSFQSKFQRTTAQNDNSGIYVTLNYTLFADLNELKTKATDTIARSKQRDAAHADAASIAAVKKAAAIQKATAVPRPMLAASPPGSPPLAPQRPAIGDRKPSATAPLPVPVAAPRTTTRAARTYVTDKVDIEKPQISQMGEATPGLRSSFLGYHWDLESPIPRHLHEFGTIPLEELMKMLLNLYGKQLRSPAVASQLEDDRLSVASGNTSLGRDDRSHHA